MNWLRVFGNAEASRMSQGVWPQLHARAVPSEQWWDSVAVYGAGIRVIAAFFGPYAPDVLTPPVSVFSHDFKRFEQFTKLATSSMPDEIRRQAETRDQRKSRALHTRRRHPNETQTVPTRRKGHALNRTHQ